MLLVLGGLSSNQHTHSLPPPTPGSCISVSGLPLCHMGQAHCEAWQKETFKI